MTEALTLHHPEQLQAMLSGLRMVPPPVGGLTPVGHWHAGASLHPPALTHPLDQDEALPRRALLPCQMQKLAGYVHTYLDTPLSVPALAGLIGFSRSHFCRAFKASFGMSPHQYVTRRRLAHAVELIGTTAHSLTDIAAACGFYDQSHMCHVFRRTFGCSPSRFRLAE